MQKCERGVQDSTKTFSLSPLTSEMILRFGYLVLFMYHILFSLPGTLMLKVTTSLTLTISLLYGREREEHGWKSTASKCPLYLLFQKTTFRKWFRVLLPFILGCWKYLNNWSAHLIRKLCIGCHHCCQCSNYSNWFGVSLRLVTVQRSMQVVLSSEALHRRTDYSGSLNEKWVIIEAKVCGTSFVMSFSHYYCWNGFSWILLGMMFANMSISHLLHEQR